MLSKDYITQFILNLGLQRSIKLNIGGILYTIGQITDLNWMFQKS